MIIFGFVVFLAIRKEWQISEGEAVIIAATLAAALSFIEYKRRLDETRLAAAVALHSEISVNAEGTVAALGADSLANLRRLISEKNRPFIVVGVIRYPIFESHQKELTLLPTNLVRLLVNFYETEIFMMTAYHALGGDAFDKIGLERKESFLNLIEERFRSEYLPAAKAILLDLENFIEENGGRAQNSSVQLDQPSLSPTAPIERSATSSASRPPMSDELS